MLLKSENIFKVWDFNTLHLSFLRNEIEKETKKQMLQYELKKGYQYLPVFELSCLFKLQISCCAWWVWNHLRVLCDGDL